MAFGERLSNLGTCLQTPIKLLGVLLIVVFYLLPLEGYDVVLGTQWLSTLGSIEWDFSKLSIKFKVTWKDVVLQDLSTLENKLVSYLQCQQVMRKRKKKRLFTTLKC